MYLWVLLSIVLTSCGALASVVKGTLEGEEVFETRGDEEAGGVILDMILEYHDLVPP